mmetsp:Transcript_96405/g.152473  ORF Transcript_96405/g.152473 Transcript_96405/m.152473 type:complete len:169 (+) Transcript_96405:58-564(+)
MRRCHILRLLALSIGAFLVAADPDPSSKTVDEPKDGAENAPASVGAPTVNATSAAGSSIAATPAPKLVSKAVKEQPDMQDGETKDSEDSGGSSSFLAVIGIAIFLVCGGVYCFRKLTMPKGTPPPLLADAELSEGDPVDGGAMRFLNAGAQQARQLMSTDEPTGFSQF